MSNKIVAVYGGFGALGRNLISAIKRRNYVAISIDLKENPQAEHSIVLKNQSVPGQHMTLSLHDGSESEELIEQNLNKILSGRKLDAVVNVAGGFVMGDLKENTLLAQVDSMWKVSVQSSLLSAIAASRHLKESGLLVLPGAHSALSATPGVIAYGIAKASVHHLVKSFANPKLCGLPVDTTTIGIVPSMLDTEGNRNAMPNADFSSWTPLEHVSEEILKWVDGAERPKSGSLIKLVTKNGKTEFILQPF